MREKPLILVVDDLAESREIYAEFLSDSGYGVAQAGDGAQAVRTAQEVLPDLVVMDLTLPVMDGWEATRRIKADPRLSGVPVVALTGHVSDRRSREAGCDSVLVKPCMPDELIAEIVRLLDSSRSATSRA